MKIMLSLCSCLLAAGTFLCAAEKTVCASTFPIYVFTKNITQGVPGVKTLLLVPPGTGCPHAYTLTPGDMKKLAAKNMILVMNGLGLDDFCLKPLAKVNPHAIRIDSSKGIKVLPYNGCKHDHKYKEHGKHDDHDGHECHDKGNPHLFASPFTAKSVVGNIAEGLIKADPANQGLYRKNAKVYLQKLDMLCREFKTLSSTFKNKKIVTQHGVFDYLAADTGLVIAGTLAADDETALTAKDMMELIRMIRREKVAAVFTEPQYSSRAAKTIAKNSGIPAAELDPAASGPANAGNDHYEKVMRNNMKIMKEVLAK